jgi:predicted nuclease with TOPRIM domain
MSKKNATNPSVPDGGSVPVAETPEAAPTIDLAKEIEDARQAAAALSTQNDDLRAGIEDYRKALSALQDENTRLQDENTRLQDENTRLQDENTRLQDENTHLQDELNRLGQRECGKCRYPLISCICPKEVS